MMRLQALEIYLEKSETGVGPKKLCKPATTVPSPVLLPCAVTTTSKPAVTIIIQGAPLTTIPPPGAQGPQQPGKGVQSPPKQLGTTKPPSQQKPGAFSAKQPPPAPPKTPQKPRPTASPPAISTPGPAPAPSSTPAAPAPAPAPAPAAPAPAPTPAPAPAPAAPAPAPAVLPLNQPQLVLPPPPHPPSPVTSYDATLLPLITINSTIQSPGTWISSGNGQMDLQVRYSTVLVTWTVKVAFTSFSSSYTDKRLTRTHLSWWCHRYDNFSSEPYYSCRTFCIDSNISNSNNHNNNNQQMNFTIVILNPANRKYF